VTKCYNVNIRQQLVTKHNIKEKQKTDGVKHTYLRGGGEH